MNLHSRLMRFLGKDNPKATEIAVIVTLMGCFTVWDGVFQTEQLGDVTFGAVVILCGVVWLIWLAGFVNALKFLAVAGVAAVTAALTAPLIDAGLDRIGLSWLSMVVGVLFFIVSLIIGVLALFDLIEARFS